MTPAGGIRPDDHSRPVETDDERPPPPPPAAPPEDVIIVRPDTEGDEAWEGRDRARKDMLAEEAFRFPSPEPAGNGNGHGHGFDPRRFRKLLFGLLLLGVLAFAPGPRDLSVDGQRAIALFVFLVYMWVSEALPLPITALTAGVGLLLLGIKDDPNEAFEPYAQDTFFFILGSLILADGITKSGADEVLAHRILKVFGHDTHTLLFGIVASTAILAAFVSDHAIAAIMLPLILGLLRNTGLRRNPRIAAAFIMAVAFGANIAGLATPSGGSRNAIALGYMRDLYDIQVDYLDWMLHAAPITLVLIPVVYLVLAGVYRVPYQKLDRTKLDDGNVRLNRQQRWAVTILIVTVLLWVFASHTLGLGAIAVIGSVLMFAAGILDWEDTRSTIPWGVAFVYGAALVMGRVLKETGAADWLAAHAFAVMPVHTALLLVVVVVLVTVIMTNFLSDGATVAVIAPITLALALLAGYSVESMGILTALSSAFAFVLVIGTPPNLIVYASGLVRPKDFFKAGLPMTLAAVGITLAAAFWYWPWLTGQ